MNKSTLLSMVNALDCDYEMGLWSEANNFLQRQENIVDFTIKYNIKQYDILVTLLEYDSNTAKEIFSAFVRFIEYNSTFYLRENFKSSIEYYLLSAAECKKAFLFHIVFK